ncbi:MAG: sigma-70 family RNA polymerase sigma factor [bacterium]
MTNYKVDITGINTSEITVLKNKEMIELFKSMQEGDLEAKDKLIEGNLKLVLSILKKFNKVNVNKDDLFQVGVIGLIKAIDNFDLSYNLQFSTYAVYLIIGEVKRYLRDNTSIRVSRSTKDLAYQIIKFKDEYLNINGTYPTNREIALSLNIDEFSVGYALDALKEPMSMFEPIYNDGGDAIYLQDKLSDDSSYYDNDTLLSLKDALNVLKEREKEVLIERFIIGKTQTELAELYNISQAQVSRIEKTAINNVRKLIK